MLGTQDPGSPPGFVAYYTGLSPGAHKQDPANYFPGANENAYATDYDTFTCDTATGLETPTRFIDTIYTRDPDGALRVNLFIPSQVSIVPSPVTSASSRSPPLPSATRNLSEARQCQRLVQLGPAARFSDRLGYGHVGLLPGRGLRPAHAMEVTLVVVLAVTALSLPVAALMPRERRHNAGRLEGGGSLGRNLPCFPPRPNWPTTRTRRWPGCGRVIPSAGSRR